MGPEQDLASHGAEDEELKEEEGTQDTITGRQQPWGQGRPGVPLCCWLTAALCLSPAVAANGTAAFPGQTQHSESSRLGVSLGAGRGWGPAHPVGMCDTLVPVPTGPGGVLGPQGWGGARPRWLHRAQRAGWR